MGEQSDDTNGIPIFRKFTALYAKQGLSTHGNNPGQTEAKSGGEDERRCRHFSGTLGSSALRQTVPVAGAGPPLLKQLTETKAARSLEVLDVKTEQL